MYYLHLTRAQCKVGLREGVRDLFKSSHRMVCFPLSLLLPFRLVMDHIELNTVQVCKDLPQPAKPEPTSSQAVPTPARDHPEDITLQENHSIHVDTDTVVNETQLAPVDGGFSAWAVVRAPTISL